MLAADHICAERRGFGGRAMPETEKPPARPEDNYLPFDFGFRPVGETFNVCFMPHDDQHP